MFSNWYECSLKKLTWSQSWLECVIYYEEFVFQMVSLDNLISVSLHVANNFGDWNKKWCMPYIYLNKVFGSWKILFCRLRSSLWLQFKPHHIAAGAAFLAANYLNMDLAAYYNIWDEFQTTPSILQGTLCAFS